MSSYRLYIDTDGTIKTYNKITELLGLIPEAVNTESELTHAYSKWIYEVEQKEDDAFVDFINKFLDILEPKFLELEKLDNNRDDITFWLLYEYDQQCGLAFRAEDLKRLGINGIKLNIDCWQKDSFITF